MSNSYQVVMSGVANNSHRHQFKSHCPYCGYRGVFQNVGKDLWLDSGYSIGTRFCENVDCKSIVIVLFHQSGRVIRSFPGTDLTLDLKNIPDGIKASYSEARECFLNNCFTASAIMLRKTLELICEERGAAGQNLKKRIVDVSDKVVIPEPLKKGMDKIRLLGNDAAHVHSRVFGRVGKIELEVTFKFVKELVKAIYQYDSLLDELEALEVKPPPEDSP